jgi:hypothetical protein
MGEQLLTVIVTIITAIGASGGFWAYLQKRDTRKNATNQLLLGLAHNEIIRQGMTYIERGSITKDEYEDLEKYLYGPYSEFGGNGLAEKVMAEVKLLPMTGAHKTRARIVKEHNEHDYSPRSQGSYAE